ncbi:MAG TPA: indole-3-glycerol phosphate synthase TrpC [Acetobacteraceae bacterium]|jgi:indole-3-glycerol phosphate synthase|nr:indole-3-glycerol phosphate synthase TrpC [Acetobacteraceae bacterium]
MDITPYTMDQAVNGCPDGADILARICAEKRAEVERRRAAIPLEVLKGKLDGPPRGFYAALKETTGAGRIGLIAEIKRASPSGGMIRSEFDPAALARAYRAGGATCLSVLTDGPHFHGDPAHLRIARAAVDLPVLRKDFILDPWQVYESRAMGADCILLIMAALSDTQALELENLARALDMDVIAEVHDRAELDRALGLQTPMIGINNRSLRTLKTRLDTTLELAPHVPPERFLVAESGIRTPSDLRRLAGTGAQSFLVGETLLRQPDVAAAVRELLGEPGPIAGP